MRPVRPCEEKPVRAKMRKSEYVGPAIDQALVVQSSRGMRRTDSGRANQLDSERRLQDVEERSSEKSEYSSTEFQGFVGLSPGRPISMMSQSCCRIAMADRPASGSNRQERHCEADTDCGRP
jgi:hypothetical protein